MPKSHFNPETNEWIPQEDILRAEKKEIEKDLEQHAPELPRAKLHELEHRLEEIEIQLKVLSPDNTSPKKPFNPLVH